MSALYKKGKEGIADDTIQLSTAVFKALLVRGYTPTTPTGSPTASYPTHKFVSDVTGAGGTVVATSAAHPELWDGLGVCFDAGLGPTGGTLYDHAGRRLDGTLTNMDPATDWVVTERGHALDFDGSNDRIATPSITYDSLVVTCSAWVYASGGTGTFKVIAESSSNFNTNSNSWALFWDYTNSRIYGDIRGTGYREEYATAPSTQQWHHICAIFDRTTSNGDVRLFINGIEASTTISVNTGVGSTNFSAYALYLAGRGAGSQNFASRLSEVGIWSRAITPSEIMALYLGASPLTLRRRAVVFVGAGGAQTVTLASIASGEQAMNPTVTLNVAPGAIASGEQAVNPGVQLTVSTATIASGEQLFNPVASLNAGLASIFSGDQAFGLTLAFGGVQSISLDSIPSSEAIYSVGIPQIHRMRWGHGKVMAKNRRLFGQIARRAGLNVRS